MYNNHGNNTDINTERAAPRSGNSPQVPAFRGKENGHGIGYKISPTSYWRPETGGEETLPGLIPEEEGQQQLFPTSRHRRHSMRATPPHSTPPLHYTPPIL